MPEPGEGLPAKSTNALPVVSAETVKAVADTYTQHEHWGSRLEEMKQELLQNNPYLVQFIESRMAKHPKQLHAPILEAVIGTLLILEHQIKSDWLSSLQVGEEPKTN